LNTLLARPELQNMLAFLEQNKEQQYIILVNDIRCLARNTVDFLQRRNAINP